jgi:heptosyltransferase-2
MNDRIIILALSGIGDALMFTPALALLRKHRPEIPVDALVMYRGVEDIYRRSGLFDNIYYFDFLAEGALRSLRFVLAHRGRYSHSISVYPSNRAEYNIINFLLGAPHRGAVKYLRQDGKNLGFLNSVTVTEDDAVHNAQENIAIVKKMFAICTDEEPALQFTLLQGDKLYANEALARMNLNGDTPIIGFHAGCSTLKNHINRRWEPPKFAELGKRLIKDLNADILLFGGLDEMELKRVIGKEMDSPRCHIVHTENLAQTAALIEACDVFVTNDSSLMHVAAAMQRKVVAIIGPTNTHYIHPWKTEHRIVSLHLECAPCFFYSPNPLTCSRTDVPYKCIRELDVAKVYAAVREMRGFHGYSGVHP